MFLFNFVCSFAASSLEKDMNTFLQGMGSDFCDVKLLLEDTPIPAHRAILVARSAYFEALFRSFDPVNKTVNVSDFCYLLHNLLVHVW